MNIDKLNNTRKKITFLSLILTILIVIISLFLLLLGSRFLLCYILAPITLIILLFLESKLLIMPLYDNLKKDIFSNLLNEHYQNINVNKTNNKFIFLDDYFSNDSYFKTNKYEIIFDSFKVLSCDIFKKAKKGSNSSENGKVIEIPIFFNKPLNFAFISENKACSKRISDYLKTKYLNFNENITSLKTYQSYSVFYNEEYDYDILKLIENFKDYNMLIANDKKLIIIYFDNVTNFEFKLQDKLSKNQIIDYKSSLKNYFFELDLINKERKNNHV